MTPQRPRLSGLQFAMLETIATGLYLTMGQAQCYDQRPFRSMLIRRWVAYKTGRGFHITPEGRKAHDEFLHTEIARKNPLLPLTRYFDGTQYGLHGPAKVREMRRGAA